MMKYNIIGILLLTSWASLSGQQPELVPLDCNPVLYNSGVGRFALKSTGSVDTVSLPFIDDFSYYDKSPYPDPALWTDRYVFINNNYPVRPRSNGVATFDALSPDGYIYTNSSPRFPADTLTSAPVDLGESGIANVYLSFFYQPQGFGDAPESGDSLILQFKSREREWRSVWNTPGTSIAPFKQVMMPVPQKYLYKGFQFRFVNMVSLDSDNFNPGKKMNADHWHIDYVRLDKDRNENDTAMVDVAVIEPIKSLIIGYTSIPWSQFKHASATKLASQTSITYRNNDTTDYFVMRELEITDVYRPSIPIIISGGGENILGGQTTTFYQDLLNHFISTSVDSASFELKAYLQTDNNDRKENDTVRFYQVFKNYFARDDGIPESGYGYISDKSQDCAIACRYETFAPDTLQAVSLYFNPTDTNNVTSRYIFKIAVWKDENGRPGEQVYLSNAEYSPKEKGRFTTYVLENPVFVNKNYWIGWQQVTLGFLNVGIDRNYNDSGNIWYNSWGTWQQANVNGTLMIRPYLGQRSDFFTSVVPPESIEKTNMKIYPNPASQYIYIDRDDATETHFSEYDIEIYGADGRLRYRGVYAGGEMSVSFLEQGLYVVRLIHKRSKQTRMQKLLIVK